MRSKKPVGFGRVPFGAGIRRFIFDSLWAVASRIVRKKPGLVLFGAHLGNRFGDNSGYLFEFMLKEKKNTFNFAWVTKSREAVTYVRNLGGKAYLSKSCSGIWHCLRAGIIVTSHGTKDVLMYGTKANGVKEVYLHHGIPLRKTDLTKRNEGLRDDTFYAKQTENIDYMICTSEWGGRQQQKNIPVNWSKVLITGYPRNDIFFNEKEKRARVQKFKMDFGLRSYVILYAPTWRKWGEVKFFPFPDFELERLSRFLREKDMNVVLRPHWVDLGRSQDQKFWRKVAENKNGIRIITPTDFSDSQKLMMVADCLVTDYSSIYYDYLLLDRPIMFVPYDKEEYVERMGGFNCEYEEFTPGPKVMSQESFERYLSMCRSGKDEYGEKRQELCRLAHAFQDGGACRRVAETIERISRE